MSKAFFTPETLFKPYILSFSVFDIGVDIELIHTPGETEYHVTVWLLNQRIVMTGDNMYKLFRNVYAIRGVIRKPMQMVSKFRRRQTPQS